MTGVRTGMGIGIGDGRAPQKKEKDGCDERQLLHNHLNYKGTSLGLLRKSGLHVKKTGLLRIL